MLSVLLLATVSAFCAAADETTLTIRTSDGLILLLDSEEKLAGIRDSLRGRLAGPVGTGAALGALRLAGRLPGGMEVYYSERPGTRWRRPEVERMPLEEAVRRGLVPNVIGRELVDAYLLLRANGMKMGLLGEPPPESALVGGVSVALHSSMIGVERSSITVNGESFTVSGSGYLLVVLNPAGDEVIADGSFGTYGGFEEGEAMERFLLAQPRDSILLGVNFMGPGVFITGGALDAMRRYGVHAPMDPQMPVSHAFVGRKGLAPGAGAEAHARAQDSRITIFPKMAYIDESGISSLEESASSISTVVLSGTAPESEVVITR